MAANNKVELLISANDQASKKLDEVNSSIEDLGKSAKKTAASTDDLQESINGLSSVRKVIADYQDATAKVEQLESAFKSLSEQLSEQRKVVAGALDNEKKYTNAVLDQKRVIDELKASEAKTADARKARTQSVIEARDALRRLVEQEKAAEVERKKEERYLSAIEKQYKSTNHAKNKAADSAARMGDKLQKAGVDTNNLAASQAKLESSINKTTQAIKRKNEVQEKSNQNAIFDRSGTRQTLDYGQRLVGQIYAMAAAYVSLYGAIDLVASSYKLYNREMATINKLNVSLEGDMKAVNQEMKWLTDTAEKFGIILSDAQAEYSKFAVAGRAAGASTEEVRQIFLAMAEASRVMKWSAAEFNGAMNAVSQMMSKQKITAEELQNQLGERMPNAIAAFAESIRMPNESLQDATVRMRKLMEQGQLTSEMILGFANVIRRDMGTQAAQAAHQLQAEFNRLITATEQLKKSFMTKAEGDLRDAIVDLTDYLKTEDAQKLVDGLATALTGLVKAFQFALENIDTIVTALEVLLAYKLAKIVTGAITNLNNLNDTLGKNVFVKLAADLAALAVAYTTVDAAIDEMNGSIEETEFDFIESAFEGLKGVISETVKSIRLLKAEIAGFNPFGVNIEADNLRSQFLREKKSVNDENYAKFERSLTPAVKATPVTNTPKQTDDEWAKQALLDIEAGQRATALSKRTANTDEMEKAAKEREKFAQKIADMEVALNAKVAKSYEEKLTVINNKYNELEKTAQKLGNTQALNTINSMRSLEINELELDRAKELAEYEKSRYDEKFKLMTREESFIDKAFENRRMMYDELERLRNRGDNASIEAANELEKKLLGNSADLKVRIDELVASYDKFTTDPNVRESLGIDDRIEQLNQLKVSLNDTREIVAVTKTQFDQMLSEGLTGVLSEFGQSLTQVFQGVGSLSDAFDNAGRAFQSFASSFLIRIGEMIIQTMIFKALQGTTLGNMAGIGKAHEGGIAGSTTMNATLDTSVFSNAIRYHSGGIAGLKPNEVPTVLERGEEVLTRDDPRHRYNGGMGGTEVNVIDQRGAGAPPVEVSRSNSNGIEQIKVLIKEQVVGLMNTGNLDTAMAGNFNINRTGVRR